MINKYYEFFGNMVRLNNWHNPDSIYKFELEFDGLNRVDVDNVESHFTALLERAKQYFDESYKVSNVEAMETKAAYNYYTIIENPGKPVIDVALTEDMLVWMRQSLLKHHGDTVKNIDQYTAKIKGCLALDKYSSLADFMSSIHNETIKRHCLAQSLVVLDDLIKGTLTEAYFRENSAVTNWIRNALNGIAEKNIRPQNDPRPEVKYQYRGLALTKNIDDVSKYASQMYNDIHMRYNYNEHDNKNSVRITLLKKKERVSKELNIFILYPSLKKDLRKLRSDNLARNNWRANAIRINNEHMTHMWDEFNDMKVKLMLLGYAEHKVVRLLAWYGFGNTKLPYKVSSYTDTCELTKQIAPSKFLVPLVLFGKRNDETIMANYYYLNVCNGQGARRDGTTRYQSNGENNTWFEVALPEHQYYSSVLGHHKYNVLDYLTPKASKGENVSAYNKDKGYRPTPYLGVELEIERQPICKERITEDVLASLGRDFIIVKHDGTLKGHCPFEVVTVPATLMAHKEKWAEFMGNTELKAQLSSYKSGNCGMHVHISRDSFTGLHLAKFMRFINCADNHKFITKIAQRGATRYSMYNNAPMTDPDPRQPSLIRQLFRGPNEHYDAVNTSNPNTVEVRIFRGNLAKTAFFKNLEFVHALWAYTLVCGIKELNYKEFLMWLFDSDKNHHKLYANLEKWLIAANFNISNVTIKSSFTAVEKKRLLEKRKKVKKMQLIISRNFKPTEENVGRDKRTELLASA